MIDAEGFRLNVGMILANQEGCVFWARRAGQDAWQFPQGGVKEEEQPEEAAYRELHEELGLEPHDVQLLGCTQEWLRYRLPKHLIRYYSLPLCIGQKQKWYLFQLVGSDQKIRLDLTLQPEFDSWRWVNYWHPLDQVIAFKRDVYRRALQELKPFLQQEADYSNVDCVSEA